MVSGEEVAEFLQFLFSSFFWFCVMVAVIAFVLGLTIGWFV